MANKIEIDVLVDGKNLKKVEVQAGKTGKALKGVSGNAESLNRGLKGVSKQSSNSSKNFSKMAQGLTQGLVPAYAELAANIFAITAGFRFLQSAGDLRLLQEGQVAYASATGIALQSLTRDVIAATDAQIKYTDAAQASAIGTAAGLQTVQITQLGKAAKDASLILGRDVTDSFNRLVRGVTKAEPELLDELGIILRLTDASEKYAAVIGKNANELTQFEKTQAVANDVLTQAEDKYGRIIDIVSPGTNSVNQLAKSFDDLINTVKTGSLGLFEPLIKGFTEFPTIAILAMTGIAKSVLTRAIPSLERLQEEQAGILLDAKRKSDIARREYDRLGTSIDNAAAKAKVLQELQQKNLQTPTFKDPNSKAALAIADIQAGRGDALSARQLAGLERAVTNNKTITDAVKKQWLDALGQIRAGTTLTTKHMESSMTLAATSWQKAWANLRTRWAFTMLQMRTLAVKTAVFITRAFSVLSWVGIAASVGVYVYQLAKSALGIEKVASESEVAAEKFKSLNEEFSKFNQVQSVLTEGSQNATSFFGSLANKIGQADVAMASFLGSLASGEFDEFISGDRRLGFVDSNIEALKRLANFAPGVDFATEQAPETFGQFLNTKLLSDDAKEFGAFLSGLQRDFDLLNDRFAGEGPAALNKYGTALKDLLASNPSDNFQELLSTLLAASPAVAELGAKISQFPRLVQENQQAFATALTGFVGNTREESILKELRKELTLRGEINELDSEEVSLLNSKIGLLERITAEQFRQKKAQLDSRVESTLGGIGLDGQAKSLFDIQAKILANQAEIEQKLFQEENISYVAQLAKDLNLTQAQALQLSARERDLLQAQNAELQYQLDLETKLADIADEKLKLQNYQIRAGIGLTKNLTENLEQEVKLQQLAMDKARITAELSLFTSERLSKEQELSSFQRMQRDQLLRNLEINEAQTAELARQLSLYGRVVDAATQAGESATQTAIGDLIKNDESSLKDSVVTIVRSVLEAMADQLARKLTDSLFETLFNKTTIISNAQIQANIIQQGMYTGAVQGAAILSNAISTASASSGSSSSGISNLFGLFGSSAGTATPAPSGNSFLNNSINAMASSGVGFQAFATGGVVDRPTVSLLGEGKHNEAIVPLPNGKSIPVVMSGGGTNNVSVSVNVSADGEATTSLAGEGGAGAERLGIAISNAVKQELQNQKRAGGILSPYGVS